jgi:Uma2 family endonuclease
MPTLLKLRPADHGRTISAEEFEAARGEEGYRFELIDGKVVVSPVAELDHDSVLEWLNDHLKAYRLRHPEVINYVSTHSRVFVPDSPSLTLPQPDLAAYRNFPDHLPFDERDWRDISPVLVVEVLSPDDAQKDLVRNVELYLQVPSVQEYWILDPRHGANQLTLRAYRRRGRRWLRPIEVAAGAEYSTRFLPGFALLIDPRLAGPTS